MYRRCIGHRGLVLEFKTCSKKSGVSLLEYAKGPSPLREIHISLKPEANGLINVTYYSYQL